MALKSNWAILPVTVGVHLVNFVDHSGQFAHLTTVPAQFTISKTWHAASLTPHWRGGGLPPCEKRVTKTGASKGGFFSAKEGVKKRNTSPKGPKNGWLRGGIQKLRTLYLHHPTHTLVQNLASSIFLKFNFWQISYATAHTHYPGTQQMAQSR